MTLESRCDLFAAHRVAVYLQLSPPEGVTRVTVALTSLGAHVT
jgi:hypothetical protein